MRCWRSRRNCQRGRNTRDKITLKFWTFWRKAKFARMAVGKGFFDQYSVFCVFGSVVGCVVVPLITQSVESVIFSAIVISLTATHLTKRASKSDNTNQVYGVKEVEKRSNRKAKDRDTQNGQTKRKKNVSQQVMITRSSDNRKRREVDLEKLELARQQELDRKQEEKKEKKMKKKEERMRKKEQEKEEKEREDQKLKKLKEERLKENLRQQEKIASQKQEAHKSRTSTSKISKKSESLTLKPVFQPVTPTILTVDALSRERTKSESSDTCPSPPPSVWKVPEYVEPKWNPGSAEKLSNTSNTKLNNDIVCKKSKVTAPFNQLYNPVHSNQSFCKNHYMNQEKESCLMEPTTGTSYTLLKDMDKPDNRQHIQGDSYSSFSGLPDILSQLKQGQREDLQVRSYSLFGSDQPDSSVFRSPLTGL